MSDPSSFPFPPEPAGNPGDGFLSPPVISDVVLEAEPAPVLVPPPKPSPGLLGTILWILVYLGIQVGVGVGCTIGFVLWKVISQGPKALDNLPAILKELIGPEFIIIVLVCNFMAGIGIPALLHRGQGLRRLAVRGIHPLHLFLALGMVLPLLMAMGQVGGFLHQLRKGPSAEMPEEYRQLAELPWYLVLFMGGLLPAVGEEAFFRGFLGRGLVGRYGAPRGIGITSLLFGLMHFDSLEHIITTALLGCCLHGVYLLTKTLVAPVLMHLANNSLAFGMLALVDDRAKQGAIDVEALADTEKMVPILGMAAAAALVSLGILLYQTRLRWVLPNGAEWSPGYQTAEMPPAFLQARPQRRAARWEAVAAAVICWAAFATVLALFGSKG
jgi:membrane protease YdiL (CAAX protease family)